VFFRKEGAILDSDILESTRLFTASRPLVISQLAVGEYEVQVDQTSKMVRIPEQDSVFIPFEKVEINTMVIRGFIAGSSAATSGLEIGDQVIAFNGATFSGMKEMNAIVTSLYSEPEVTLTIIRNGNELTLTLPLTFLMEVVARYIEM
jgi:S1-C subfamily serine protease